MDELGWTGRARCQGAAAELFFVRGLREAGPALRLCQRCEVRDPCLEYALANDIDHGVWGGLTERQRRSLQRRDDRREQVVELLQR